MFNFRIIDTPDGNQIIDTTLKTPYTALTPLQMVEYMEIDNRLAYVERIKKRQKREVERQRKAKKNPFYRLVCACRMVIL